MMATWQARNLPVLCANPDRKVQMADKVIYCAGAVAKSMKKPAARWSGSASPIYRFTTKPVRNWPPCWMAEDSGGGDGPKTDIPGAANAGIDALFISGGLAGASGHAIDTPQDIAALLAEENTHAHYAMRHLVW